MSKLIQFVIVFSVLIQIFDDVETKGEIPPQQVKDSALFKPVLKTEDTDIRNGIRWKPQLSDQNRTSDISGNQQSISILQRGTTTCYICTNCSQVNYNTPTRVCPRSYDAPRHRKCVTYAEYYKYMKQPLYIRGCVSQRGSCVDIRKARERTNVSLLFCEECIGDRCNILSGGIRAVPDKATAFILFIATPLVGKLVLS